MATVSVAPLTGSLRDIAAKKGHDKVTGILDEVLPDHPEVREITGRTITGTTLKITSRKNNPKGAFRRANEGVVPGAAEYYERFVQTKIFENPIVVDKRVAQADEDGEDAYCAMRSEEHVSGALEGLAEQFYYGKDAEDELGFPGLEAQAELGVDAGGTTADTASSAYLIRLGDDGVQWLYGEGTGIDVGPFFTQFLPDPKNPLKLLPALVAEMGLWVGLKVGHKASIVRIFNLTEENGKGMTDALVAKALQKMPAAFRNNKSKLLLLMNGRSTTQLQNSRTAVSQVAYKNGAVADYPTESQGVKILDTDSIRINEPIVD